VPAFPQRTLAKKIITLVGLNFKLRVKLLYSLFYFALALLEILYFLEKDVIEVLDVACFLGLLNFEEFELGESEGSELCSEFD